MSKVNLNQLKKSVSNMKNYTDSKTKTITEKYDAYILNNAVPESSVTAEVYGDQSTLYKISDSDIVFPENSILTDEDLKYKLSSINRLSETQKCIITYNDGTQDITKNIELDQGIYYSDTNDGLIIMLREEYTDENGESKFGLFVMVVVEDNSSSPQSDERLMRPTYKYLEVKKITLYIELYKNQLPDKAIIDLNFDKITNLPTDIENLKNNEADVLTREEKILLIKNRSPWGSENIDDYNKAPYTTSAPNNTFRNANNIKQGIGVKAKKPALGKGLKIEPFYYVYTYYLYYRKSPNVVIDIINSKGTIIHSLDSNEDADTLQIYNLGANSFDKNNDCYFVFSLKEDAPTDGVYGVYQFHLINMGDSILTYDDIDKKLDKKEISKYASISYVDDKISSIPDAYTLLYPKEVDGTTAYYNIYDLPLGDYRIAQQSNIKTLNICVYVNNIRTQILSTSNCRGFSFTIRSNSKFTSNKKPGRMILIDVFSITTGGEIFTFDAYDDGNVEIRKHQATILSANTETEFIPTNPYHPTTKKYVDDKVVGLATETYVDSKTSMENVIYEGNGTGADVISDYWTECPVSSGNGCWVINKQIEFDSSKPNPYYLLCDNTLYSPENSTFDATNSAWIYPKVYNTGTIFICNKYNGENKLILPWDNANSPLKMKLYTKTELAKAMFSGDYNDLSNKPTIPSIDGLATEEYVNNKVTDTATSLTNDPDIYLNKDKYQYVTGVNTVNNMIWLPSTDLPAFLKIHLYVTNCKMQCVFDTPVKWKISQKPNEGTFKIVTDNIYEFILTYINGSWIGEFVTYSNTEYIPTNDADVTTKKYVDDRLNNLNIKTVTQSEYDSLSTKEPNTLYLITD